MDILKIKRTDTQDWRVSLDPGALPQAGGLRAPAFHAEPPPPSGPRDGAAVPVSAWWPAHSAHLKVKPVTNGHGKGGRAVSFRGEKPRGPE